MQDHRTLLVSDRTEYMSREIVWETSIPVRDSRVANTFTEDTLSELLRGVDGMSPGGDQKFMLVHAGSGCHRSDPIG